MLRIAGDALAATSVTVLSDYRKGVLSGDVPQKIIEAARTAGRKIVVDPRGPDYDRYAGADIAVPSLRELELATGMNVSSAKRIASAAGWLRTAHGFGAVVVNRGAEGLSVISADGALHLPPAVSEVFDLSGASDTVVSALGRRFGHRASAFPSPPAWPNLAMGVSAGQPGMAVAQGTDLLAMLTPQGRALRKIVATEVAVEQVDRWRRMGLRTALITGSTRRFSKTRLETRARYLRPPGARARSTHRRRIRRQRQAHASRSSGTHRRRPDLHLRRRQNKSIRFCNCGPTC